MSIPIIKQSCDQIALIESALYGTGQMARVAIVGTNTKLFEIQRDFKPVLFINQYELAVRGGLAGVRLTFEYNLNENRASIKTNRKGIEVLKEIMPETFKDIKEDMGEEIELNVKTYTKLKTA